MSAPAATVVAAVTPTKVPPTPVPPTATSTPTPPALEPPAGYKRHLDLASGVSLFVPESRTITEPGSRGGVTLLQSYPADKYVGGEAFRPGDTKCDLMIHPAGVDAADLVQQIRSSPSIRVVSEQEVVLNSGHVGTWMEIESMGRSLSMIAALQAAEGNERAVVLTCFGDLEPFDEIAVTLRAHAS